MVLFQLMDLKNIFLNTMTLRKFTFQILLGTSVLEISTAAIEDSTLNTIFCSTFRVIDVFKFCSAATYYALLHFTFVMSCCLIIKMYLKMANNTVLGGVLCFTYFHTVV